MIATLTRTVIAASALWCGAASAQPEGKCPDGLVCDGSVPALDHNSVQPSHIGEWNFSDGFPIGSAQPQNSDHTICTYDGKIRELTCSAPGSVIRPEGKCHVGIDCGGLFYGPEDAKPEPTGIELVGINQKCPPDHIEVISVDSDAFRAKVCVRTDK